MPTSLLEDDLKPHYEAWKTNPSPETAGALLHKVHPIITEAMRTYGGNASASPTLRGKAKRLALHAIEQYDPARAKLRTHLITQLQGLRRMATKEEQAVRVPEQLLLDRRHLHSAEAELKDKLGRDPSTAELADHSGLSLRRIKRIRLVPSVFAESSLMRESDEGASLSQPTIKSSPTSQAKSAWLEFVYHDLDPLDQYILEASSGLHGQKMLPNQDIARKLRITPGAVSQRKLRIQNKLNLAPETGLFGE